MRSKKIYGERRNLKDNDNKFSEAEKGSYLIRVVERSKQCFRYAQTA
jgi:hypothetical protein